MIKALKVVMIVFGAITVILGLLYVSMHDLAAEMFNFGAAPSYVNWMGSVIGVAFIAGGAWIIVAGLDPLRHINWVKYAITWCLLSVVIDVVSIFQSYVDFSQIGTGIIMDSIFAILFLVFYPWRVKESSA